MEEISLSDQRYPALLRQTKGPPASLFCLGEWPKPETVIVAIVGTRKATADGCLLAKRTAADLARAGVTVVSGLALGIDGAAHEGALQGGGRTIAVLARGLDEIYPAAHAGLAQRIIDSGGAILSEYPPGMPPLPQQFLERNRIVAGLSVAAVIVEAPIHSGALVTARLAAEEGREVYVLPGAAGNANYAGSHLLIRNGARLVTSAADILEDLEPMLAHYGLALERLSGTPVGAGDETDRVILEALAANGTPLSFDKLAQMVNLETHTVSERLTYLILQGSVTEENGRYRSKRK